MVYVERPIIGHGEATPAQLRAAIVQRGQNLAAVFAPDHIYAPPPEGIEQIIVEECNRYPDHPVDADGATSQVNVETAGWQSEYARERNNPGGIGAEDDNPDDAYYFTTPREAFRAHIAHLLDYAVGRGPWTVDDPRAEHMPESWFGSCPTFAALQGKWATSKTYASSIEACWTALARIVAQTGGSVPAQRPPHIALSAGHRNASGGDAHEKQQTAVLTPAIAAACRALGMDVRVVQGHDGADMFTGDLHAVAQTVANWDAAAWPVDIYLEVHTQSSNGARGMFVIYPDWPSASDTDNDVKDRLGPDIVDRVTKRTRLTRWTDGIMSERESNVGAGGDRLGIFAFTSSIRDHAARLIVEFGAHDNAQDLAIVDAPGFAVLAGDAVAEAFAAFLGWEQPATQPNQPSTPPDDKIHFAEVPYVISGGFKGYYDMLNLTHQPGSEVGAGFLTFGFPRSDEFRVQIDGKSRVTQVFDNAALVWQPDQPFPYDVRPALGRQYLDILDQGDASGDVDLEPIGMTATVAAYREALAHATG